MPQEQQEEEPMRRKEDPWEEVAVSNLSEGEPPSVPTVDVMDTGLHIANRITNVMEIIFHSLL